MDDTWEIELTRNEACYLSDVLSMHMLGPPEAEILGRPYPEFFLRLGSILRTLIDPQISTVPLRLTESELWHIREVAKTPVTVGTEKVGLNLLLKSYEGLLHLNNSKHFALGLMTAQEPWDKAGTLAKLQRRLDYNETRRQRRRQQKEHKHGNSTT